jgi:hypothetical protein
MPDRKPFVPLVDRVREPWQRLVVALAGVALCLSIGAVVDRAFADESPAETYIGQDTTCLDSNELDDTNYDCTVTGAGEVSEAAPVTEADRQEAFEARVISSIRTIPNASYCRTWSQSMGGVAWREKHVGKMCYSYYSRQVWVWGAPDCPRCPTGYHYCDRGWGVGYSVAVSNCRIRKIYDSAFRGGYFRQNWDRFHVYVVAQGIPAYRSYDMHVNVFATGAVRFHY